MEIKDIAISIKDRLGKEKDTQVEFPSIGRADVKYDKDVEIYWLVRAITSTTTYNRDIKGNITSGISGPLSVLEDESNERVLTRDSKMGKFLIQKGIGDSVYEPPPQGKLSPKPIKLKVSSFSSYIPKLYPYTDAIDGNILTEKNKIFFKSLVEQFNLEKEIEKLRKDLEQPEINESRRKILIEQIKEKEQELQKEKNRKRKHIITTAGLRDQPILDPIQETIKTSKIFDEQLIITGGPGTGKTTSLIQRITFLTSNYITEHKTDLTNDDLKLILNQEKSWIFFSPTELLREYLRNIMTKEGLKADKQRVLVWDIYRKIIFRQFSLINPETQRPFQAYSSEQDFYDVDAEKLLTLTKEFDIYFLDNIKTKVKKIISLDTEILEKIELTKEIKLILSEIDKIIKIEDYFRILNRLKNTFSDRANKTSKEYQKKLENVSAECMLKIEEDKTLYEFIVTEIKNIKQAEEEQEDEFEKDMEEEGKVIDVSRSEVFKLIKRIIRIDAMREIDVNTKLPKNLKSIFEKLEHLLPKTSYGDIQYDAYFIKYFDKILKGIEVNVLGEIPTTYKSFRKNVLSTSNFITGEGKKFINNQIKDNYNKIFRDEMDFVMINIMSYIHNIYNLYQELYRTSTHTYVRAFRDVVKMVIAIDEATDFSIMQLVCMSYLSYPKYRCVTLSGDIMQRLNKKGITGWEEYIKIFPNASIQNLRKSYRQTEYLIEIAKRIYKNNTKEDLDIIPGFDKSEDDPPPLIYKGEDYNIKINWVANRIVEIHKQYGEKLPTIAIFLKNDEIIDSFTKDLNNEITLQDIDVKAAACRDGVVLGDAENIRIFNIKYIKGMEFEAVFFIDIDNLELEDQNMIEHYLYVGVSRASFYLAVTVNNTFPDSLAYLKDLFKEGGWS